MSPYHLSKVLSTLGLDVQGLAKFFRISHQAVYPWARRKAIPRDRQLQLRAKFPRKFPEPRA